MADEALRPEDAATELARLQALLGELEELEPRLAAHTDADVTLDLLEQAAEMVEECSRLLERLGRLTA